MKKNGFMFVETIVTLTILMSLLLALYTVFVNLLQKEKVNAEYDKFGERMSLFYYKESLGDAGIIAKLGTYSGVKYYDDSFGLDIPSKTENKPCNVAIFKCSEGRVDDSNVDPDSSCLGSSKDFDNYKSGFKTCPEGAQYAIFGEFGYQDDGQSKYTYAHIYYPNINLEEE